MQNTNIIFGINGEEYLLFNWPIPGSGKIPRAFDLMVQKHEGIQQGAQIIKGYFFHKTYLQTQILIPCRNAEAFSNDCYKNYL